MDPIAFTIELTGEAVELGEGRFWAETRGDDTAFGRRPGALPARPPARRGRVARPVGRDQLRRRRRDHIPRPWTARVESRSSAEARRRGLRGHRRPRPARGRLRVRDLQLPARRRRRVDRPPPGSAVRRRGTRPKGRPMRLQLIVTLAAVGLLVGATPIHAGGSVAIASCGQTVTASAVLIQDLSCSGTGNRRRRNRDHHRPEGVHGHGRPGSRRLRDRRLRRLRQGQHQERHRARLRRRRDRAERRRRTEGHERRRHRKLDRRHRRTRATPRRSRR